MRADARMLMGCLFRHRSQHMCEETPRSAVTDATEYSDAASSVPVSRAASSNPGCAELFVWRPISPERGRVGVGDGTSKTPNSSLLHARRSGSIPPLPPASRDGDTCSCHADVRGSHSDAQVLEVTQTLLHYIPKPIPEPAEEEITVSSCGGSEDPQIRSRIGRERHSALRGAQTSNVDLHIAAQGQYGSKRACVCVCVCVCPRARVQELIDR
jgi:hypothetical protein